MPHLPHRRAPSSARTLVCVAALALATDLVPRGIRAQASAPDAPVCLGFTFGPWTPKLDWRAAGHGPPVDTSRLERAPLGRDWAVNTQGGAHEPDSLMILFPAFWPAGVSVDLPTRTPAPGDTVLGTARAFVANAAKRSPTATVRAWRVSCSR